MIDAIDQSRRPSALSDRPNCSVPQSFAEHDNALVAIEVLFEGGGRSRSGAAPASRRTGTDQAFLRRNGPSAPNVIGADAGATIHAIAVNGAALPAPIEHVGRSSHRTGRGRCGACSSAPALPGAVGSGRSTTALSTLNIVTVVPMPSARTSVTETANSRSRRRPRKPSRTSPASRTASATAARAALFLYCAECHRLLSNDVVHAEIDDDLAVVIRGMPDGERGSGQAACSCRRNARLLSSRALAGVRGRSLPCVHLRERLAQIHEQLVLRPGPAADRRSRGRGAAPSSRSR